MEITHGSVGYIEEFCTKNSGVEVQIITSGGVIIPVHPMILISASPIFESIMVRLQKRRSTDKSIPILGVPCGAVVAFVRYLYSSRCSGKDMQEYGVHLLVLSHAFLISGLKRECKRGLEKQVKVENVIDMLKLARLCDAPDLYIKCLKVVREQFKDVEQTEAWKFVQRHDPGLELELLQFVEESNTRKKRRMREKETQSMYMQLSEAMECLKHICTEGCTMVGPLDKDFSKVDGPCEFHETCQNLQFLIRHFSTCNKKVHGGCPLCKTMRQLFRLHASICYHQSDCCKVPLCRQLKSRMQMEKKEESLKWQLLARKVISAKVISRLSKRKKGEELLRQTSFSTNGSFY